jgi:hypothetical protein
MVRAGLAAGEPGIVDLSTEEAGKPRSLIVDAFVVTADITEAMTLSRSALSG